MTGHSDLQGGASSRSDSIEIIASGGEGSEQLQGSSAAEGSTDLDLPR